MRIANLLGKIVSVCMLTLPCVVKADVFIGQSAPLSGEAAETGKGLVLGARIYFEHINRTEGGVNGHRIIHLVKDDGYKIEATVNNTREFIANPGLIALTGYYGTDNLFELFRQNLFGNNSPVMVGGTSGSPVRSA